MTSADGLVNCGATCAVDYNPATPVVLTAKAADGWTFSGWAGCGSVDSQTNSCSVTMDSARTATVVFSQNTSPLTFVPVTPCRVADTRGPFGQFGGPAMIGGFTRDFPIPQSSCGIPSTAAAYSLNFTVVPHGSLGYLTVWPTG